MRDYKKYDVWSKAHELTLFIYEDIVPLLPKTEQFALSNQIRRAAYSVPLNIVEGCGRNSDKDFVHFLDISLGSLHELEYCVLLAKDLNFITEELYLFATEKTNEIKAKLINLIKSIRQNALSV